MPRQNSPKSVVACVTPAYSVVEGVGTSLWGGGGDVMEAPRAAHRRSTQHENAAFKNNRVTFGFPDFYVHSAMDVIPSTSRCNSAVNKQFGGLEIGELFGI